MERVKSARRSLFGRVDHEQLRRDLQQELREMAERDSRRWNFDFQAGTPLSGGLQWEEIPAERAPVLYRDPITFLNGGRKSTDTNQENCPNISNKCAQEKTPLRRKRRTRRPLSAPGAKRRANALITDFFPKRKKREAKSILTPFQPSSKETLQCRTMG